MSELEGFAAFGAWCDAFIVDYERGPRLYYWLGLVWVAILVGSPLAAIGLHASTLYRPGPVVAFFNRILEFPFRPILNRLPSKFSDNGIGYLAAVIWFFGLMGASEFYAEGRELTGPVVIVVLFPLLFPVVGAFLIEPLQKLTKKIWWETKSLLHDVRYWTSGRLRDTRHVIERWLYEFKEFLRPARIRAWLRNLWLSRY